KPMERRAIIEEAAGVTKFKTKKRLSEAKLESSKLNLARVNDIVVEVEKQLGSLKRQASKARRYSEIREQMRGIVRQMLAGKARELDAEAERLGGRLAELTAAETQQAQSIHEQEAEQDRLNQRIYSLDAEIRQNQNVLNHTALEVDRNENRIAFNQTRGAELAGRNDQIAAERQAVTAQTSDWEARNAAQQQVVENVRTESVTVTARVEDLAARASFRTTQIAESEARVEMLRRAATQANDSLFWLHGEQKQTEEALVHQNESLRKLEEREGALLESSIHVRDDAERAAQDWQNAMNQLGGLQRKAAELQARISELRKNREVTGKHADSLRDSLAGVRAGYLTDSAVTAEKLAREYPQYAFVTPEGTCYQGRMVTGGKPDDAGPLGMKRELRAMDAEVGHLEHHSGLIQAELESITVELRTCEQANEELSAQQREAERNFFSTKHHHEQMQNELARLGLDLTVCQGELARVRKEIAAVQQRAERAKLQHETAATSRAEAEAESARLAEEVVQLRARVQTEQEELATARAELAAMNERMASVEAIAQRLQE